MEDNRLQILLTNDDGIQSPGLWAAAEALSKLGYVTVAAPRDQASSTGRSLPITSDGRIEELELQIGTQNWTAYSVGGTPAQVVLHSVLEIMPRKPDLVVAGINYGENVGDGITISGTVGAAMEAASLGYRAMAVSLQLLDQSFYGYSREVDFSTAAYFSWYFARLMLEKKMPEDVRLIKVEVPAGATPETPWRVVRQAPFRYFQPLPPKREKLGDSAPIPYVLSVKPGDVSADTDVHTLVYDRVVAVTPLSLEMTSRVNLKEFEKMLRESSH